MNLSSLFKVTSAFGLASLTSASFFAIDAHAISMFASFSGTGLSLSLKQNQSVRLLIPIRSGLEYSRLQQNYPNVKILETPNGVFVLVSDFKKAAPAYKLGKQIQNKFGYAFQLSYSNNHPDLNMAWLRNIGSLHAKKTNIKPATSVTSTSVPKAIKTIYSEDAKDLGSTLQVKTPFVDEKPEELNLDKNVNERLASINHSVSSKPNAPLLNLNPDKFVSTRVVVDTQIAARPTAPPPLDTTSSNISSSDKTRQPKNAISSQIVSIPSSVNSPKSGWQAKESFIKLRRGISTSNRVGNPSRITARPTPPPPVRSISLISSETNNSPQREKSISPEIHDKTIAYSAHRQSLVKPVAIKSVHLDNVLIGSANYIAINPSVNYLYVHINSADDYNKIAGFKHAPTLMRSKNNQLIAKVGVYTNSRVGNKLRNQKLLEIKAAGLSVAAPELFSV